MDAVTAQQKYHVVLNPQIRTGFERDIVVQSFAELFKISEQKAAQVIGKRQVLKKNIDLAQAQRYQSKLKSIGLDVSLSKVGEKGVTEPTAKKPGRSRKMALELVPTEQDSQQVSNPANSPSSSTMICPKCNLEQPKSEQCAGCGVYMSKVADQQTINPATMPTTSTAVKTEPVTSADETPFDDSLGIKMLAVPAIAALLGALLWKVVAVAFHVELGLIAWLIGGAIGFAAAMAGLRGQNAAMVCALLAVLAIFGGKYWATSSFVSEVATAFNDTNSYEGVDLQDVYQQMQIDAIQFTSSVTDEESLRQFMVTNQYTEAVDPASVTAEEIEWFEEFERPYLERMTNQTMTFDEWKNEALTSGLEQLSTFDLMMEGLGMMDILFLFLGVGTAYRLAMGNDS